ncbi:hypothetical protein RB2654_14995 [Rhodobacterales bacterium HTCC2654]|uniref:Uncharacterized protein n=1 Tax=Maritimibacter alkaliphilus HTCC2654 TaxID=314271 RepID=A3VH48_9RHOB|nr:hypothetical protein RB2654_14995 [Rhodobacterales bacterium HTCC2654] [Maritimibacter alkaliphilus HTCC2654]
MRRAWKPARPTSTFRFSSGRS